MMVELKLWAPVKVLKMGRMNQLFVGKEWLKDVPTMLGIRMAIEMVLLNLLPGTREVQKVLQIG